MKKSKKKIQPKKGQKHMTLKYFTDANSAAGYVSLQKENLTGITKIYHLKSPDDKLINNLLKQISLSLVPRRLAPEYIYSTFNPDFLAGLVIRELDTAFVSGKVVTASAEVICLKSVYDESEIRKNKAEIDRISTNMNQFYKKMYMHFNAALHIHDEWEKIYIDRMDFEKADKLKEEVLSRLFDTKIPPNGRGARHVRRFFGASTPDGLRDFIPVLTAGLKRYFIKGRPGSGKSTLMREVVKKAARLGYDADIYHCSLDPKSLDMVVVPELNFCIFDATSPHAYEPVLTTDETIDTYTSFIKAGTDEHCATVLEDIEARYNNQIKLALAAMKEGHTTRAQLSDIYTGALVAEEFDTVVNELFSKL